MSRDEAAIEDLFSMLVHAPRGHGSVNLRGAVDRAEPACVGEVAIYRSTVVTFCAALHDSKSSRGCGFAGLQAWPASPGPVRVAAGVRRVSARFNRLFT